MRTGKSDHRFSTEPRRACRTLWTEGASFFIAARLCCQPADVGGRVV